MPNVACSQPRACTVNEPGPEEFERWVTLTAVRDAAARSALIGALWPHLEQYVMKQPSVRATGMAKDCARDVTLRIIDRLVGDKLAHQYLEWKRAHGVNERFLNWVTKVAENETADYMRRLLGRSRSPKQVQARNAARDDGQFEQEPERVPSRKGLLNVFTKYLTEQHHPSTRPPFTNIQAVNELMQYAQAHLSPIELRVLELWLDESSSREIERKLRLSPGTAESLRRAGIARLRRHFLRSLGDDAS